jgi:hypothetical protein
MFPKKLSQLQDVMYAHNRYGVLICLQGMDTLERIVWFGKFLRIQLEELWCIVLKHPIQWVRTITCGGIIWFCQKRSLRYLTERIMKMSGQSASWIYYEWKFAGYWKPLTMLHLSFGKIECNKLIILSIHAKWNHYFKVLLHLSKEEQRQRLLRRLEEKEHNWKFR